MLSSLPASSTPPLPDIVISGEEVGRRPLRVPDFELESRVLKRLSRTLSVAPNELLQILVETLLKGLLQTPLALSITSPLSFSFACL